MTHMTGLQLHRYVAYVHVPDVLSKKFCDSYGWDSEEDISYAEQLPPPSPNRNDGQQSSIEKFTGADVYKSGLLAYLIHIYTDLIHYYLNSYTNLRSLLATSA